MTKIMSKTHTTAPIRGVLTAIVIAVVLTIAAPVRAIEVQRVEGGGVEAWLVEDRANPIISLSLAFRDGGAVSDPDGKAGLARMAAALLDEGAGNLDSRAFHSRLEELAVSLSFQAGLDTLGGRLRTLTSNRDEAFEMLRLALTEPRFDSGPVERVRSQLLAALRQAEQDPGDRAGRRSAALMFPDHPYGRGADGLTADVESVTIDDLRAYVADRLNRESLILGVVGDISAEELERLLEATFSELPESGTALSVAEIEPAAAGRVEVVDLPVPQSTVLFSQAGLSRDNPDYYAATVLNHILGGGSFTSRLYQEVREQRGLVYAVSSRLVPRPHGSLWQGYAASGNERVAETVAVIRDQWQRLAANGATDEEVAAAKTYLTGSFPLRFTSSGRIASILVAMQRENLGIDYLDRRNALIEAVTPADVRRVAEEYLTPDRLTVIVAGQPVGLTATN